MQTPTTPVANPRANLPVIWLGMLGAVLCYWIVLAVVRTGLGARNLSPVVTTFLLALCGVNFAVAWGLNRFIMRGLEQQLRPTRLGRLTPIERLKLSQRVQAVALADMAVLESPAVWGLIIGLVSARDEWFFYLLACVSLSGLLIFRLRSLPAVMERLAQIERLPSA